MSTSAQYAKCHGDPKECPRNYVLAGLTCSDKKFPCENETRRRETAAQIRNGTYVGGLVYQVLENAPQFKKAIKRLQKKYPGDGGYSSNPAKLKKSKLPKLVNLSAEQKELVIKNVAIKKRISDQTNKRAYCGDGILRYVIGHLFRVYGTGILNDVHGNPESNLVLSIVVKSNKIFFNDLSDEYTVHNRGTIYEARLCEIFEDEGIDAAIRFVVTTFSNAYSSLRAGELSQIKPY